MDRPSCQRTLCSKITAYVQVAVIDNGAQWTNWIWISYQVNYIRWQIVWQRNYILFCKRCIFLPEWNVIIFNISLQKPQRNSQSYRTSFFNQLIFNSMMIWFFFQIITFGVCIKMFLSRWQQQQTTKHIGNHIGKTTWLIEISRDHNLNDKNLKRRGKKLLS